MTTTLDGLTNLAAILPLSGVIFGGNGYVTSNPASIDLDQRLPYVSIMPGPTTYSKIKVRFVVKDSSNIPSSAVILKAALYQLGENGNGVETDLKCNGSPVLPPTFSVGTTSTCIGTTAATLDDFGGYIVLKAVVIGGIDIAATIKVDAAVSLMP